MADETSLDLSVVVCAYDMERELPRTIFTLSKAYQRGVKQIDFEILVVDNGSPIAVDETALREIEPRVRVVRFAPGNPSPLKAINEVAAQAKGRLLGLFIDGARLASPGIYRNALDAHRAAPNRVIGTIGMHLGPDVQMRSVLAGYDQAAEDRLLASQPWRKDGYRLFDISVLAGSSAGGWFRPIAESNGVFLSRQLWQSLGGLDERFVQPGGGVANLDFWKRAVEKSHGEPWMMLGEATFHQVHGGAATNGPQEARKAMFAEYEKLTGAPLAPLDYKARYIGTLRPGQAELAGENQHAHEQKRRAGSIGTRPFKANIPTGFLDQVQAGCLKTRYKGRRFAKNPFDAILYLQLLEKLRPQSIIEVGTSEGGSALWYRDQCGALGFTPTIISLDIEDNAAPVDGATLLLADSTRPAETFPHELIAKAPRPWLVVEDSAHTYDSVSAVLDYFRNKLLPGDYLVVEDGIVADLQGEVYRRYEDGPNRAVQEFMLASSDLYQIDTALCDFYGHNVTYCPNAWLKRI
ncbi:CmcI family methyltransferase [Maricaulis sp.]|uniref:CmcI family methyltransferase n=1 Tax=Maricaulis sp. TaxID=1486257 RepID=UPI00260F3E8D|nr:CmcI family methyltransferase [Maricaulis sp.]